MNKHRSLLRIKSHKSRARLYRYLTADEVGDMFDAIEDERRSRKILLRNDATIYGKMLLMRCIPIMQSISWHSVPKKDLAGYLRLCRPKKPLRSVKYCTSEDKKPQGAIMSTEYVAIAGNRDGPLGNACCQT